MSERDALRKRLTDAEWGLIDLIASGQAFGPARGTDLRAVLDAILYIAGTGCQWRLLPEDFPPFTTVQGDFYDWRDHGLFEKINSDLLLEAREAASREPCPLPESSTANRSRPPKAADHAAEPVLGRGKPRPGGCGQESQRHSVKSAMSSPTLPVCWWVPWSILPTSRIAMEPGLCVHALHDLFPWLRHLFADSVYNGPNLREALAKFGDWTIEIVTRAAEVTGFQLLPRRWVVERTFAWLNRNRRLAKDFETSIASATAWVYIASVQLLIRRLA